MGARESDAPVVRREERQLSCDTAYRGGNDSSGDAGGGVGRKSRAKADRRTGRRQPTAKEAYRAAWHAERRGRRYGSSLNEWEGLARLGPHYMYEASISRHNQRMTNISAQNTDLYYTMFDALSPVSLLASTLRKLGASKDRFPTDYFTGGWVDHLAWGASSVVSAARLALSGQYVGAALVARQQLECWTQFVARIGDESKEVGEDSLTFTARAWTAALERFQRAQDITDGAAEVGDAVLSVEDESRGDDPDSFDHPQVGEPELDHRHFITSGGESICPAATLGMLSEVLHARDFFVDALRWDTVDRCNPRDIPDAAYGAQLLISDALRLSIYAIRQGAAFEAARKKSTATFGLLVSGPDSFTAAEPAPSEPGAAASAATGRGWVRPEPWPKVPGEMSKPIPSALLPLAPDHGLRPEFLRRLERDAEVFEATLSGKRPAGRLFHDDEFTAYAFAWHRWASARSALAAIEVERRLLGDEFDIDKLRGRDVPYVLTSEACGLLAAWLPEDQTDAVAAAAAVASSLRSAYWLWLEDDDRAMGVLRVTLEQLARLRTWRRNPDKAARLESRPQTRPRDWLSAAGWKRLEVLNRALGEMAHTRERMRWFEARRMLTPLQPKGEASDPHTARGFCLTALVMLSAQEVIDTAATLSAEIADGFDEMFEWRHPDDSDDERYLEGLLARAWNARAESPR